MASTSPGARSRSQPRPSSVGARSKPPLRAYVPAIGIDERAGEGHGRDPAHQQPGGAARQPRPPPGERADPRDAEEHPRLVVELEDRVHAEQRTAVELVAHVEQLRAEQARDAGGDEHPHRAQRGRHVAVRRRPRRPRRAGRRAARRARSRAPPGASPRTRRRRRSTPRCASAARSRRAGRGRRARRTRPASRRPAPGRAPSRRSRAPPPRGRSRARPGRRRGGTGARAAR